jgi:hypothetical protein
MHRDWYLHGEPLLHWLSNSVSSATVSFVVGGLILGPLLLALRRWLKNQFDASTPGGVGDLRDAEGVPQHERWRRP